MKKAVSVLLGLLFGLTVLYPAGIILTGCFGYHFALFSIPGFVIGLAALSVLAVVLDLACRNTTENRVLQILLAILTPLSLVNSVFCVFACPQIEVIASLLLSTGCCCYLTAKHGKPMGLKIAAFVLAGVMILPIGFLNFLALIFGNFGQDTVVKTVASPSGEYYAQVIDSDQGALGGDTVVDVYQDWELNALLFKITKKPQTVYFGDWGESQNMQIYWKDDHCLVINSVEYEITS